MTRSVLGNKRLLLFFVTLWVVWLILQYIVLIQLLFDPFHAAADSICSTFLLSASCFFISNNMKYYLPRQDKYWYILVVSGTAALLWLVVLQVFLWAIFPDGDPYLRFFKSTWAVRYGAGFLLISSMSIFSLLWYSQEEQRNSDQRRVEMEKLSRDAELVKLRQQLQPHFLFNSLNSINALIAVQPEKARMMIQQLSDFLRGTLKKDDQQWDTLGEEATQLYLYLEIEKVRFGYRLQTEMKFEEAVLEAKLPVLLLQPLVENAIKFGLYDTTGPVLIRMTGRMERNYLIITVQNPFDPETSQPLKGTGFGISSVQKRLYLLFGRHDLLVTHVEEDIFSVTIIIPQLAKNETDNH